MPIVNLVTYTGAGTPDPKFEAARLLAFTKNTRLQMTPDGMKKFSNMEEKDLLDELDYMSKTIPSSWEFADVVFLITRVSRATAQQVTRSRHATFAMQSQRVTDVSEASWDNPYDIFSQPGEPERERFEMFERAMKASVDRYKALLCEDATLEDARDVLLVGLHCNIVAKYNLRSLSELVRARKSLRVQGPYRDIIVQMESLVTGIWPWSEGFFKPKNEIALKMLEEIAVELGEGGAMYKGVSGKLAKAVDLLK